MEEEIFKKSIFIEEKLLEYGFTKNANQYTYHKDILKGEFEVIVTVEKNHAKGKIIEKELDEEYLNFRIENQIGEFVSTIKEEFLKILEDIKEKCTIDSTFVYDQSNRISNWIKETFKDSPEFLWDDDVNAVFRNNQNKKWYGIIMYINKNKLEKLEKEDKKVEVMNVKLPPEQIDELVKKKGYYRAYHMNKKYWITFILDDTIDDDELKKLIRKSYEYTIDTKDWVIPANPAYWDVIHRFDNQDEIDWKQINNIEIGDYVFLYVGKPYSCILYKCQVLEKDIKSPYPSFPTCMRIRLVKRYKETDYPFEKLKKLDLRAIRGPRRMPVKLLKEMEKAEKDV